MTIAEYPALPRPNSKNGEATEGHTLSPLFGWRAAIAHSDLEPVSRLVALTLSLHMSELGSSAFPSVNTLAAETGLTGRAVQIHLRKLVAAGYLRVEERCRGNGSSTSNLYTASIPPDPSPELMGGEPPFRGGVNVVQGLKGVNGGSPPEDVVKATDEGLRAEQMRGFDAFWSAYPARNGKKLEKAKAVEQWKKIPLAEKRAAWRGAKNYAAACAANRALAKDAFRWLRDRNWDEWQTPADTAPSVTAPSDFTGLPDDQVPLHERERREQFRALGMEHLL